MILVAGAVLLTAGLSAARADVPAPPAQDMAPVALLVDLSAGQTLFAREADSRFLPASMTKAMTALIAFDLLRAGRLNEDAVFTVSPQAAARWSGKGTTMWLRAGQRIKVSDLIAGAVTASANDAAVVLAEGALGSEQAWLDAMNARARALGMTGSNFASANGLPDGRKTYVNGRDMIRLAQSLITEHPALYRRYFGHHAFAWQGQQLISRNPFAGILPGADGIKTGHTSEAGYTFLGAVERDQRRLVLVIARSPSEAARAVAARNLAEWGYSAWESRPFLVPGADVGSVRVQGGDARDVAVTVPRAFSIAVPRGQRPKISARILYDGPIRAPIAKGTAIGGLEVTIEGQPIHYLPLVAVKSVGSAGPIDRVVNALLGLIE